MSEMEEFQVIYGYIIGIQTRMIPTSPPPEPIAWWIILVSALGGLLPIVILVLILWKITMSSSSDDNQKPYSIDLKSCIEKYAWKKYRESNGFCRDLLISKNKHYVDIRWGYLQFNHQTTKPVNGDEMRLRDPKSENMDLYISDFENKTSVTQHYTFTATRETLSSLSVEVMDNYTLDGSMNLEIELPRSVKLGGGFSQSLSVTNKSGEKFEKALKWQVNTEVKVKPWHKAEATLIVEQINMVYDFQVKTTVSLPQGHLPVAIRRKKDDEIVCVLWIMQLPLIFDEDLRKRKIIDIKEEHLTDINRIRENVQFTTNGVCKSVFWIKQHVEVKSNEMPDMPEQIKSALDNDNENK